MALIVVVFSQPQDAAAGEEISNRFVVRVLANRQATHQKLKWIYKTKVYWKLNDMQC